MSIGSGDLVVCVNVTPSTPHPLICEALRRLVIGRVYKVLYAGPGFCGNPSLGLAGVGNADIFLPWNDTWQTYHFRKIESDPNLANITARIKSCKPTKVVS